MPLPYPTHGPDGAPSVICGTGHRPGKLGGYSNAVRDDLVNLAGGWLDMHRPGVVISGMALGWDQALAIAALKRKIETRAYVPCEGQDRMWPDESRRLYHKILRHCSRVLTVTRGGYSPEVMQRRNEMMVDDSVLVLALWNGSPGGTANCVRYAEGKNRPVFNLWNVWSVKI